MRFYFNVFFRWQKRILKEAFPKQPFLPIVSPCASLQLTHGISGVSDRRPRPLTPFAERRTGDGRYMTTYIDQAVAREICPNIDSVTDPFGPPRKAMKTRSGFIAQRMV